VRFRTRDRILVHGIGCECGRGGPRITCVGRTDDMLIVRGVNVFPSAVREVVGGFAPAVSGNVLVRPQAPGVKQEPPLPVAVELARDAAPDGALGEAIREKIRAVLTIQARVELVPWGTLQRSEWKARLVDR
jgi:phenylacetate-CoA ligase